MQTPYLVYGTLYENDGSTPDASASLTIKNETTSETLTTTTNSIGQYIFDCANFTSNYADGDYVTVTLNESGSVGQDLKIKIISRGYGQISEFDVSYST